MQAPTPRLVPFFRFFRYFLFAAPEYLFDQSAQSRHQITQFVPWASFWVAISRRSRLMRPSEK
jgi:hypothetical protein